MMTREVLAGVALLTWATACRTGQVSTAGTLGEDGSVGDARAVADGGIDVLAEGALMDGLAVDGGQVDGASANDSAVADGLVVTCSPTLVHRFWVS